MPRRCRDIRGDAPQGYLFRFAPLRGHRPVRKVYRECVRATSLPPALRATSLAEGGYVKEYTVSFGGAQPDFLVAFSAGIGYNRRCKPEVAEKTAEKSAAQLQDDRHSAAGRYTGTQKEQGGTLWHLVNSCRRCAGRPD